MMRTKELTWERATEWSRLAHVLYLDALMTCSSWDRSQLAFHGGSSLHLSWNSARYSEDLDFLLARDITSLTGVAKKVAERLAEQFHSIDPSFVVTVEERSKAPERMVTYQISVQNPAYRGKVKVKAEFWRTHRDYLRKYPTQLRTPNTHLIRHPLQPVPAATLETAYADKLTAFATRPYVKWRDIYDLWWIGTQSQTQLEVRVVSAQFLHNVRAYEPSGGLAPASALRALLGHTKRALVAKADPDLRRWLPREHWRTLYPAGIAEMVDYAFYTLEAVADAIEMPRAKATVDLSRAPRKRSTP
jgi:predicted nucleotidyltransferase component of viral defense system